MKYSFEEEHRAGIPAPIAGGLTKLLTWLTSDTTPKALKDEITAELEKAKQALMDGQRYEQLRDFVNLEKTFNVEIDVIVRD